jgi:putative ABC transport system permease protein
VLGNYLKIAVKVLLRRKFFTFISLFGISVSLLVLLVTAALLDHVFAPHAPEVRSDRTLGMYMISMQGPHASGNSQPGYGFLDRWVRPMAGMAEVETVSIFRGAQRRLSYVDGRRIESYLKQTDGEFWRVYSFDFLEGGPFLPDDEKNARAVAVINETTRQHFFGGAPAVGRSLTVDGQRFRVVGVVKDVPFLRFLSFSDIWVPTSTSRSQAYRTDWRGDFQAVLLARDRSGFPAIKRELAARLRQAEKQMPERDLFDHIYGGADTLFEATARALLSDGMRETHPEKLLALMLTGMAFFLLLPTLNLVNINLSRILERSSEIGVRKAFGASSGALIGQLVIENVVLTLIGGAIGLVLAAAVLAGINASGLVPYAQFALNFRIFLQGLGIALFFGLLSGIYPAWRMSKLRPVQALQGRPM